MDNNFKPEKFKLINILIFNLCKRYDYLKSCLRSKFFFFSIWAVFVVFLVAIQIHILSRPYKGISKIECQICNKTLAEQTFTFMFKCKNHLIVYIYIGIKATSFAHWGHSLDTDHKMIKVDLTKDKSLFHWLQWILDRLLKGNEGIYPMKHLNMKIVSLKSHWKPLSFDFSRIICRMRNDCVGRANRTRPLEHDTWSRPLCQGMQSVFPHPQTVTVAAIARLKQSWGGAAKPGAGVSPTHHCFPRGGWSLCYIMHRIGLLQPPTTTLVLLLSWVSSAVGTFRQDNG